MADVTARKNHEEHSIQLTGVLEHVQDAVLVTDDRFVLTAWNKGAVAMFGWTAEEPQDESNLDVGSEGRMSAEEHEPELVVSHDVHEVIKPVEFGILIRFHRVDVESVSSEMPLASR